MALHSLLFSLLTILIVLAKTEPVLCNYTSIFAFGDSYTDTGNLICLYPNDHSFHFPYGETYFGHPTGRCSNGRLIIDFMAQSLRLPFLPPYLGRKTGQEFLRGVNFAIAGAKALDDAFYEERGIHNTYQNIYLGIQLGWFKELLPSLCDQSSLTDCPDFFSRSIFLLGEIGGNDYGNALVVGRSLEEIRTFVPYVIDVISSAIQVRQRSEIEIGNEATHIRQQISMKTCPPNSLPLTVQLMDQPLNGHNHNNQTIHMLIKRVTHLKVFNKDFPNETVHGLRRPETVHILAGF